MSLIILRKFPTPSGSINILEKVGSKFKEIGNILLQSDDGAKVKTIEMSKNGDVDNIVHEIFRKWINESVESTWGHLVQCLRDVNLDPLADKIDRCLS